MASVTIWSAGGPGPPESTPGLGSGKAFQQGDLALIGLPGDHRRLTLPETLLELTPEFLDPMPGAAAIMELSFF